MDGLLPDDIKPSSEWEEDIHSDRPRSDPPILIIEAGFSTQSAIKQLLELFGLRNVTVTGRGYRAIEVSERRKFGVILVANRLVQIDGVEVIQSIRERGMNIDTPVVFIGEHENDYMIRKAFQYGATASLHRPLAPETLQAILENILKIPLTTPEEERVRVQKSMEPMKRAVKFAKKLRSEGEFEIAEEEFKKGLVEIFCGLAEVYLSKGDREAAESALTEAEQIDPQAREKFGVREENFVEQGQSCLRKKAFAGAKAEFHAALTLNGENVSALVGIGEAHCHLNEDTEANETFNHLMEVNAGAGPDDSRILKKMALIACKNNKIDLAWMAIDRALKLYPSDAKLYYLKAIAYIAEGRIEDTLIPLEKALLLDPELTEAHVLEKKVRQMLEKKQGHLKPEEEKTLDDYWMH